MKEIMLYQNIEMNKMKQKYKQKREVLTYLLTPDSYIEITKDGMKQKFLSHSNSYQVDAYYKNQPIFVNQTTYNSKPIHYIPFKHEVLTIQRTSYKLHPKANVVFIEDICNKMKKYYFHIYGDEHNFMIKEDIVSFLSMLM